MAFLLVTVSTTACSPLISNNRSEDSPTLLVASQPTNSVREAAIAGVLELRDGCFVVTDDEGDWLIEWPFGSTLGEDGESVDVPDFGTVRLGDVLEGAGGYSMSQTQCRTDNVQGTASLDLLVGR